MSLQTDFLRRAIETDVATAANDYPSAIRTDEQTALERMSKDDLKKLLEVRDAIDNQGPIAMESTGNGIFSF